MSGEQPGQDTNVPNVVAHPPVLYAAGLAAGGILEWLLPSAALIAGLGLPHRAIGLAAIGLGLALAVWCFWHFMKAGTNIPTNRPVQALVTDGPYRLSRNPIYVALTVVSAGIALAVPSLWMLVAIVPVLAVMNEGVIKREEALLARMFGADYDAYRGRVRRWI